jgi:hypothetical protein
MSVSLSMCVQHSNTKHKMHTMHHQECSLVLYANTNPPRAHCGPFFDDALAKEIATVNIHMCSPCNIFSSPKPLQRYQEAREHRVKDIGHGTRPTAYTSEGHLNEFV